MQRVAGVVAVLLLLGVAGYFYASTSTAAAYEESDQLAADVDEAFTDANNGFALQLHRTLRADGQENVFISPISIATALSMAYEGANGSTRAAMAETLNYNEEQFAAADEYRRLLRSLNMVDEQVELNTANSVWLREGYPVRDAYLSTMQDDYRAEVFERLAVDDMNAWVADETDGMIDQLINSLPGNAVMVLLNAIYFQGEWAEAFDPEDTDEADFHTADGPVTVDMMQQDEMEVGYYEDVDVEAVRLPYGRDKVAMYVFAPKLSGETPQGELDAFISELERADLATYVEAMQENQTVDVYLPTFEMAYGTESLQTQLEQLGMAEAFQQTADFSRMSPANPYVHDVLHKAVIEVDEEGTEAAAATGVVMAESAQLDQTVFRADRPFFFVIRDDRTGSILFMGSMDRPGDA